jgi:hypothetical protein
VRFLGEENEVRKTEYPIRFRVDSEYTNDATAEEAVAALRGEHGPGEDGYHRSKSVSVVRVYPETVTVPAGPGRREVTYQAGEPLFSQRVTVYGQDTGFTELRGAQVSWSSLGACDVDETNAYVELLRLATGLAAAANQKFCARCEAERDARNARMNRIREEAEAR